jgi:hypothetical protein
MLSYGTKCGSWLVSIGKSYSVEFFYSLNHPGHLNFKIRFCADKQLFKLIDRIYSSISYAAITLVFFKSGNKKSRDECFWLSSVCKPKHRAHLTPILMYLDECQNGTATKRSITQRLCHKT